MPGPARLPSGFGRTVLAVGLLALSAAPACTAEPLRAGRYEIRSSDSYVGYRIHKLGLVPVRGHFGRVAGEIVLDLESPEASSATVRVPLASLESGNEGRTETLLSEDFFDAESHPEMRFESRRVRRAGDGRWLVTGGLTIRGMTRTVTCPVAIRAAQGIESPVLVLATRFEIDRKEFGVLGSRWSGGRDLLSDTVEIELTLTAER